MVLKILFFSVSLETVDTRRVERQKLLCKSNPYPGRTRPINKLCCKPELVQGNYPWGCITVSSDWHSQAFLVPLQGSRESESRTQPLHRPKRRRTPRAIPVVLPLYLRTPFSSRGISQFFVLCKSDPQKEVLQRNRGSSGLSCYSTLDIPLLILP